MPTDPEALADYFTFTDFAHFIDVYLSVVDLIRTPEDVRLLTYEMARELARQHVRYAELTITPYSSTRRGIDERAFMEAIEDARKAAEAEFGTVLRWCFDIPGEAGLPVGRGDGAARHGDRLRPEGLVSFGLGGPEIGVARPQFKPYFDRAIAAGLHSVPHAGETTGPETVWDALTAAGRRAHRPRHQLRTGPEAAGAPRRAPHPAGGVPDLQHRHPGGAHASTSTRSRSSWGRGPGHRQLRRPADVRHRPQQRVRGRRPAARPGRAGCRRARENAVEASFLDAAGKARIADEIDTYTAAWLSA